MAYAGLVVSIPVAQAGFTGSKNPTQISPAHLTSVNGMDLNGGLIQKEGGASKLNASALGSPSAVRAGISWSPVPGTYQTLVFVSNGTVQRDDDDDGDFDTTLASSLNDATEPPPVFVAGGGETVGAALHMFMFSGTNQVQEVTGTGNTMQAISTPPSDWASNFPTFGVNHSGRLWGGGNSNDPHRLYYSTLGDHEDFTGTGSGTIAIYPGEGERLVGAISYRGVLVAFKYPTGIYVVDTRDPVPANWIVQKLSNSVGGVNGSTIIQIDSDVLFLDSSGNVNSLAAANIIGDMTSSDIGRGNEVGAFVRNTVNMVRLQRAIGLWYPIRRQAWFMFPSGTNDDCDLREVIDFSRMDLGPRVLWSDRDEGAALWTKADSTNVLRPMLGGTDGFVWALDQENRNKDGNAYQLYFETASTDLSFADPQLKTLAKTGQFLEVISEPTGDWYLTVEVYWDDNLTDTVLFSAGWGGSYLGAFTLGTSPLAASSVRHERKRISGSGRRLRLVAYNNNVDQDVKISDFILSFVTQDERGAVAAA